MQNGWNQNKKEFALFLYKKYKFIKILTFLYKLMTIHKHSKQLKWLNFTEIFTYDMSNYVE